MSRTRTALVAVLVALGLGLVATPAEAVVPSYTYQATVTDHAGNVTGTTTVRVYTGEAARIGCSVGASVFCVWSSTGYTGGLTVLSAPNNECINFVYPYDENADSAKNRANWTVNAYTSYNGSGHGMGFQAHAQTANIAASDPLMGNNNMSSICE